jgi:ribosomal protein S12 methylthiotransferase accessory factor YcaO
LIARWGKELDEAQKQGLLEAIENNVQNGKTLRAKSLYNGQEPPTVFYVTPPAPR